MSLYAVECFANDTLQITEGLYLNNSVSWSVTSQVITLDFLEIFDSANTNNNIGILQCNLVPITPNNIIIAGANNFTLSILANNYQTAQMMLGSINPAERTLIIQTVFNGNGVTSHANNQYLRIKNAQI